MAIGRPKKEGEIKSSGIHLRITPSIMKTYNRISEVKGVTRAVILEQWVLKEAEELGILPKKEI
jgi:hypothetical protein